MKQSGIDASQLGATKWNAADRLLSLLRDAGLQGFL